MRPDFYDIYRALNEHYRSSQRDVSRMGPRTGDAEIIDEIIEETLKELNLQKQLRPDARLFLLINIHQLVLLPLSYTRHKPSPGLVRQMVREDLRLVLGIASDESGEREISGHGLVSALSRIWEKLNITQLEIWG